MADPSPEATIKMYGADWCADTRIARRFMQEHAIAYEWIDVEKSPAAREWVRQINHGFVSVPTLLLPDGSTLTEPSWEELAARLLPADG
jgi:glutaredoxin